MPNFRFRHYERLLVVALATAAVAACSGEPAAAPAPSADDRLHVVTTITVLADMVAEVGGRYHMRFTNLTTGHSHGFGGEYLELVPDQRLRYTARFDDASLPGQMQTTVTLAKVSVGTDVRIVQEGIPSMIPVEACYLGWQQSLQLLALLVEPEIRE